MKKTILLVIVTLGIILSMIACTRGSYSVVNGVEWNSATRFSMTYDRFNGFKEKDMTVEEGSEIEVFVQFVTISGSLDASICRKDDSSTCAYEGNDIPSSTFSVTLNEAGTYVLRVDARRHSGSYSFHWN